MTTTNRMATGIAVALALGASAAPASARPAQFAPFEVPAASTRAASPEASTRAAVQAASTRAALQAVSPAAPAIVRVTPSNGGFDWTDAGIGAAGGLALAAIGGGLAVSQRRKEHRHHGTAAIS
jgi:hypothetical protein